MDEQTVFTEALAKETPRERAIYLDGACGQRSALRDRVEKLLEVHGRSEDFLQDPVVSPATLRPEAIETTGTQIGPYKLCEQIGEGGMGAVYMATQKEPVRRDVALKIIKAGMDTREVIARFGAERQALALMNHPHIAKVLDAGATESGRPYFVMELVRGIPITDYCDRHQLDLTQRLELFMTVCQAVQHAHQKGIIHRDLKPSNVLVELHDVQPVPKVIDFGVAKATNQQLTEETYHTGFDQMIGTPLYMSPEQAVLSGLDVDTRSDVYSLGVLLYELLTATTPFEREHLKQAGYDEMRRIIREDEPPRPSERISTLSAAAISTVSDRKHTDLHKLSLLICGELDWIVMKALEKDRTRRYESASAFAADIQRYLDDEAVEACPPSAAYRFRKFARRNKAAMVTATVVTVALALGILGTTWQAVRVTQALDEKEGVLREKEEALKEKEAALVVAKEEQDRAEENVQLSTQLAEANLDSIGVERLLRESDGVGINEVAQKPLLSEQERELLQQLLAFYGKLARKNPSSPQALFESGKAFSRLALIQAGLNENEEAQQAYEEAISWLKRLTEQSPTRSEYFLELGKAYYQQGQLSRWWPQASGTFNEAVVALSRAIKLDPKNIEAYELRGKAYIAQTQYDNALPDYEIVVKLDPNNAAYRYDLGRFLYKKMIEHDRALLHAKEAARLDPRSHGINGNWSLVASIYQWGKHDREAAAAVWEEALEFTTDPLQEYEIRSKVSELRGDHQKTIEYVDRCFELGGEASDLHLRHAVAYRKLDESGEALAALQLAEELAASDWPYIEVAREYHAQGKFDEAMAALEKAERLNPNNPAIYMNRSAFLSDQGRHREALDNLDKSITLAPRDADNYVRRGTVYERLGRHEMAVQEYSTSLELNPNDTRALFYRGVSLQKLQRWDEAVESWKTAIQRDADNLQNSRHFAEYNLALQFKDCPDPLWRDPVRAVVHAQKAVEVVPDCGTCRRILGAAYAVLLKTAKRGEVEAFFREQLSTWEKLENDCENKSSCLVQQFDIHHRFGNWLRETQRDDEAERQFRQALEILEGFEADEQGRIDASVTCLYPRDLLRDVGSEPNSYQARLRQAVLSGLKIALALSRQAVEANPLSSGAWDEWNRVALGYYRSRNWRGAEEEARLAVKLAADRPYLLLSIALLYLLAGNETEYWQICDHLLDKSDQWSGRDLASAAYMCSLRPSPDDSERLLRLARRAVDEGPNWSPTALHSAYYRLGEFEKAIEGLMRSFNNRQNSSQQNQLHLAIAHQLAGHQAEAEAWLEKAIRSLEDWHTEWPGARIDVEVLRQEAERLIRGEKESETTDTSENKLSTTSSG